MLDHHEPERRLAEKEVTALLQRAAELQAARPEEAPAMPPREGITLAQLQQAAAELGIAPRFVQEAAWEAASLPAIPDRGSFWGGPWVTDLESTVPAPVTEAEWPALLEGIRRASGRVGTATRCGTAFEWSCSNPDLLHVTVTPAGQETRLRVLARCGEWGAAIHVGLLSLALILSLALPTALHLGPLAGLALAVVWFGGAFAAGRIAFGRFCARRRRQALAVLQRLEAQLAPSDSPGPPPAGNRPPAG